jgi:hypothetical protein
LKRSHWKQAGVFFLGIGGGWYLSTSRNELQRVEENLPVARSVAKVTSSRVGIETRWETLQHLKPSPERNLAVSRLLTEMAERQPQLAWDSASNIDDPDERRVALQFLLDHVAKSDPATAMAWLAAHPETATRQAVESLAAQFREARMDDAYRWIESLPKHYQIAALTSMVQGFTEKNPAEIARLIETKAGTETYDALARSFADSASRIDPAVAMQWSRSIRNVSARSVSQKEVVSQWVRQDPLGARRWLTSDSSLSAEERRRCHDAMDDAELNTY